MSEESVGMAIMMRAYEMRDAERIADLLASQPPATPHLLGLPWRLSAHSGLPARDVVVWENDDDVLLGLAAWQQPWAALDFFVRPGPAQHEVEERLFAWAMARFHRLDQDRGVPLPYWVELRADDAERRALVTSHGFTLDEDYTYIQLRRPLAHLPQAAPLPNSVTIRPLAGASEVAAYVALHCAAFQSESMTVAWRAQALRMPQYQPALDLVAVTPKGRLAGFLVGWLDEARQLAQIEPMGVHPDFRGMGLARALLLEGLRRFQAHGAIEAIVETESGRSPALQAYQSVGFAPAHTIIRKGLWITRRV
jgi:ribosomal protein S18 acetylase RimI-like enzyme